MAKISLSSGLQKFFDNNNELTLDAKTVAELLEVLHLKFPNSKNKIISENGQINRFIKIFVDGSDITEQKMLQTQLQAKSKVKILMALAGG